MVERNHTTGFCKSIRTGLDSLWERIGARFVLDCSKWEDDDAFNTQFAKLLKGMKIYYPPKDGA